MERPTCIHIYNGEQCNKPAFVQKTNGWLCIGHYRQQQDSIPAKPRLAQPRWVGLTLLPIDGEEIVRIDAEAIATGRVVPIHRGFPNPVTLRVLEPATVH